MKRPLWRRMVKWALLTMVCLMGLIGLVWVGLQTPWAKTRLESLASSLTANTGDYRVTLRGLGGLLPFSITVDHVALSDNKGPWLEVENFDFSMKAAQLLSGEIQVDWLRMKTLSLSRLPAPAKSDAKKEKPPAKSGPLLLPHIRVQEIQLNRIDLGEAVAGKSMAFSLKSGVKTDGSQVNLDAALTDLNHGDDAFHLMVSYDMASEHVVADLDYHESAGGLVAGLAGLRDIQNIKLFLKADGPLSGLKGSLNLNMGGYGKADFRYGLGITDPMNLEIDGQIQADRRIVPTEAVQVMDSLTFDLTCRAALSSQNVLDLKEFMIRNGKSTISLEGNADINKKRMDMRGLVSGMDIAALLKETGVSIENLSPVGITAKGSFMQPDVAISAAAGKIEAKDANFTDMTLEARTLFEPGFKGLKDAVVGLKMREVYTQQAPGLQGPLNVDLQARSPDFAAWQVKDFHMTLPGINIRVEEGAFNAALGRFSGDLQFQADRIAALLPPSQTPPMEGRLEIRGHAEGDDKSAIKANLDMAISNLSGLPPEASDLTGSKLTLAMRATMGKDRVVTLESAHLKGEHIQLKADGWLNLTKSAFDVAYNLSLDHAGNPLSSEGNLPVGRVKSRGNVFGDFQNFSAKVNLSSEMLQLKALDVKGLNVQLEARGLPQKPAGTLRLKGVAKDQPLELNSDFAWAGETLSIRKSNVRLPGIDVRASLSLTPGPNHFSGTVEGEIASMDILRDLAGVDARGAGRFRIATERQRTEVGNRRSEAQAPITLEAEFKDLKYEAYGASAVQVSARVDDMKAMRGRVSLKARDMPLGSSRIKTFNLRATGDPAGAEIALDVKGITKTATEAPLFLTAGIGVKRTDLWQIRLDALKGGYEDLKVTLQKPATVTLSDDGRIILDDLKLKTDKGQLRAMGELDRENLKTSVRISDLPLSLLEPFVGEDLTGTAVVSLELSGPLSDPGVDVAVHIKEYNIMGPNETRPLLMSVKLHSRRDGERLLADLELSGLGKTPFTAGGSIPAHISLKPFAFDINKSGKLEGKLQGKFDLAVLQALPAMTAQSLKGKVDVDMRAEGSLEKWELNGGVTIRDGRYENIEQGVLLDRIQGRFDAEGRILKLTQLTATDGNSGSIVLKGRTDVDPPFQTEIALTMEQATLLRTETLTVTTGGNLDIKGDKDRMDLTGEINLERTEIAIPKRFPPDVTVIPVSIINDPAAASSEKPPQKGGGTMIQMDLGVNIPDKFFVRGRGLDAEFKGRLTVRGPANNPVVRGSLNVVRGTFLCLSRTFKVTSGQIAFDGATPPVPYLNINTQVNAGEITAQVDVTGPADAFKLKLSSQPPLPQDEIMAQILFGQSVAKLNTFQALQMAYSVNQLAGGYGPDVMGKTRSFLGLDRLDFSGGDQEGKNNDGSNTTNGPSVTLGKYVTDRVYVGVEQDLTDNKQDVIVDVNITPNFTVESKAGTKSGAGLGFNWNYDY